MTEKAKKLGDEPIGQLNANGEYYISGLTKREYFAAMAMQAIIHENYLDDKHYSIAYEAIKYADVLLEELAK